MTRKLILVLKKILIIILWQVCSSVSAQNKIPFLLSENDSVHFIKNNIFDYKEYPQTTLPYQGIFHYNDLQFNNHFPSEFTFGNRHAVNPISLYPFHKSIIYPGLGSVEHFKTNFKLNSGNRFKYKLGVGLAMQNSVFTTNSLNYQFTFDAIIEYSFSQRISGYIYGQILTNPINNPDFKNDPLIFNNPLFLQNEVGLGVKAHLNKSTLDFKLLSGYWHQNSKFSQSQSNFRIIF